MAGLFRSFLKPPCPSVLTTGGQWRECERAIQSSPRADTHPLIFAGMGACWVTVQLPTGELQLPQKNIDDDEITEGARGTKKSMASKGGV